MEKRLSAMFAIGAILLFLIASCTSQKSVDDMTMEEKLAAIDEAVKKNPPKEMTDEQRASENAMASSMENGEIKKSGAFEGRAHPTKGSVNIVEKDGKVYVTLSEDFKSDSGPELHVILTEHADPKSSKDLHEGVYYDLGILKSTKGTQVYEVPSSMLDKIKTASIYCKPFKVIFGSASLS